MRSRPISSTRGRSTGWAGRPGRVCGGGVVYRASARHAGTAADCRQRTAACHGVSALFLGSHLLYGLSHRHRLYRSQWQCPRVLRKRTSLAYVFLPRRLGGTRAPFNHCFAPCSPTRAGIGIGDSGLSSYEIWYDGGGDAWMSRSIPTPKAPDGKTGAWCLARGY